MWGFYFPVHIYLDTVTFFFFFGSSGTLTATASWKTWVTIKLFLLFFYLRLRVWHVWVFANIQLSMSPRFLTQCSGLERLPVAAPPTVALLSTLRNLKYFLLKWRWWVNSVKRREGRAHSGVEEVRGIELFVSCLCWSAGQTHICVFFNFTPTPIYNCSCTRSSMWGKKDWVCTFFKHCVQTASLLKYLLRFCYVKCIPSLSSHRPLNKVI